MSDDLMTRLRARIHTHVDQTKLTDEAADRIDALEKELFVRGCKNWDLFVEKSLRIADLEKALAHIYAWYPISVTQPHQTIDEIREFARAALEGKDD
jgi:hypothetical protein